MGIYEIGYTLQKGAVPLYLLDLARSGLCPVLLPITFYEDGEQLRIRAQTEGLLSLRSELALLENRESLSLLLRRLRGCVEALSTARAWLAPPEALSLDLADLYFDPRGKARLLIKPTGRSPFEAASALCGQINLEAPGFNAELIIRRLFRAAEGGEPGIASILRVLTAMSLECGGNR